MTRAPRYKIPPSVKRVRRWMCVVAGLVLVALILDLHEFVAAYVNPIWLLLLELGALFGVTRWETQLARRAKRDARLGRPPCWNCGYCLEGLPSDRACPECGLPEAPRNSALWWAEFVPLFGGKVKEAPDDAGS